MYVQDGLSGSLENKRTSCPKNNPCNYKIFRCSFEIAVPLQGLVPSSSKTAPSKPNPFECRDNTKDRIQRASKFRSGTFFVMSFR